MARYIQRIALLGKERWIGWEVDGVGTEVPGLVLADELSEEELRAKGIRDFKPMPFESFLGLGAHLSRATELLDEDLQFRVDALLVGMERFRARGVTDVPRAFLTMIFEEQHLEDARLATRIAEWQRSGAVQFVGADECYLRITGRLA